MLRSARDLMDFRLQSQGADFGKIVDYIFDDFEWLIRYVVVRVGSRDVILSTGVFGSPDDEHHVLPVNIDRNTVMNSPDVNLSEPFGRNQEILLNQHYGWSPYWEMTDIPETLPGDMTAIPLIEMEMDKEPMIPTTGDEPTSTGEQNNHLHSANQVFGYEIRARDGNDGKLSDFIILDENWDLSYLVIDTGGLFGGKKVLMAPQWVQRINWAENDIQIELDKKTLHDSPEYNSANGITPDYWDNINDYYNNNQ